MHVLPDRASLQEDFASEIEDEDVDGPMTQVIHMHVLSGFCPNDAIVGINKAKHLPSMLRVDWSHQLAKSLPLSEREFLSADRFLHSQSSAELRPSFLMLRKQITQLLAAFCKSATNQRFEKHFVARRDISYRLALKDNYRGGNLRLRVKD